MLHSPSALEIIANFRRFDSGSRTVGKLLLRFFPVALLFCLVALLFCLVAMLNLLDGVVIWTDLPVDDSVPLLSIIT